MSLCEGAREMLAGDKAEMLYRVDGLKRLWHRSHREAVEGSRAWEVWVNRNDMFVAFRSVP